MLLDSKILQHLTVKSTFNRIISESWHKFCVDDKVNTVWLANILQRHCYWYRSQYCSIA